MICHWVQTLQFISVRRFSAICQHCLLWLLLSFFPSLIGLGYQIWWKHFFFIWVYFSFARFIFIIQCQLVTRYSYVHWYCARSLTSSCCHHIHVYMYDKNCFNKIYHHLSRSIDASPWVVWFGFSFFTQLFFGIIFLLFFFFILSNHQCTLTFNYTFNKWVGTHEKWRICWILGHIST